MRRLLLRQAGGNFKNDNMLLSSQRKIYPVLWILDPGNLITRYYDITCHSVCNYISVRFPKFH